MIFAAVLRQSRSLENCLRASIKPLGTNGTQLTISYRFKHQHQNGSKDHSSRQYTNWGSASMIGIATGIAAVGSFISSGSTDLLAEEPDELEQVLKKEVIDQENRIRQFSRPETIFDYFAKYQIEKEMPSIGGIKIKREILMSVKDFYNAVTPGSSLGHGIGRGVYKLIGTKDICSQEMLDEESLPSQSRHGMSVLNEIQKEGLLTYDDFSFLVNILSTPRRYMDIAFHLFDVDADGLVDVKKLSHE